MAFPSSSDVVANVQALATDYNKLRADLLVRPLVVRKTADEIVNNSVVLQDDDELLFAVGANEIWAVYLLGILLADAPASHYVKVAFTVPAAGVFTWHSTHHIGPLLQDALLAPETTSFYRFGITNAQVAHFAIWGIYVGGANAGNLQMQWAQSTAEAVNYRMQANSFIMAHQLL